MIHYVFCVLNSFSVHVQQSYSAGSSSLRQKTLLLNCLKHSACTPAFTSVTRLYHDAAHNTHLRASLPWPQTKLGGGESSKEFNADSANAQMWKVRAKHAGVSVVGCNNQHESVYLLYNLRTSRSINGNVKEMSPQLLENCVLFTPDCFFNRGPTTS